MNIESLVAAAGTCATANLVQLECCAWISGGAASWVATVDVNTEVSHRPEAVEDNANDVLQSNVAAGCIDDE
jgi:hypothetical protein